MAIGPSNDITVTRQHSHPDILVVSAMAFHRRVAFVIGRTSCEPISPSECSSNGASVGLLPKN
jgi:hypothetical protein